MRTVRWCGTACLALAAACSEPEVDATATMGHPLAAVGGVRESMTGGGEFEHPDFGRVTFAFNAVRHADGSVSGRFQQHQPAFGFTYKGDVTCFVIDRTNGRAWVGGVLTHTNDPDPVTEVGDDAWFRVLDLGNNGAEPDRSTFLGFEGAIVTSEDYCQLQIWADGNARTWPVNKGNIVLH